MIDAIIPEPVGGAHRFPEPAIDAVGDGIDARYPNSPRSMARR